MHGVTFEAVKEQLMLLGHSIPDEVIASFLAEGTLLPVDPRVKDSHSDQAAMQQPGIAAAHDLSPVSTIDPSDFREGPKRRGVLTAEEQALHFTA